MGNKKYYLGLDVGGTNLVAGVVDEEYRIISRFDSPTFADRTIDEIVADMARVSLEAVRAGGLSMDDMSSWGIGMPSCVNKKTNLLVHANCFGWRNVPIYDYLRDKLPLPVFIDNDANCAAYGESLAGAAKGCANALMLTLGTGLGGGVIIDGRIYSGADNMGSEFGHTKIVREGVRCTCGQKGCLEAYCSSTALIRIAKESVAKHPDSMLLELAGGSPDGISGKTVFDASGLGDKVAVEIVDDFIGNLVAGISSFIVLFRPEVIILGGGLSNNESLFGPLNEKVMECTFGASEIGVPKIIKASLGNDAGIIGAAYLEKIKS